MKTFSSVAQMKLAVLTAGQQVETTGYYAPGDGGQAKYLIKAAQAVDNFGDHDLAGTTVAILQYIGPALVRQFGAKGDGVTDDVAVFVAALSRSNHIEATDGHYILSAMIELDTPSIIRGSGLYCRLDHTGANYIFKLIGDSGGTHDLSGFVCEGSAAAGGIWMLEAHGTKLSNIWGLKGLTGKFIHNEGSLLCDYDKVIGTTNRFQHNPLSAQPDYAFYMESSANFPPNMTVLRGCMGEGMLSDGLFINHGDNGVVSDFQGFVKVSESTFEGNLGFDININGTNGKTIFECDISGSHTEGNGVQNVRLSNAGRCSFSQQNIQDLLIEGNSFANGFSFCQTSELVLTATTRQNVFDVCVLDWANGKTVDLGEDNIFRDNIGTGGYSTIQFLGPKNAISDGAILNADGQFKRWTSAATPQGWAGYGGSILAKEGSIRRGLSVVAKSMKITTVGITDRQGAAFNIRQEDSTIPADGWVSISGWIYKPAGYLLSPTIYADIGFFRDLLTISPDDMPDDDWYHFSTSVLIGTDTGDIVISPGRAPTGGEIIYVADVTIKVGRQGVSNFKQHPAWQQEFFLYRNLAVSTKVIRSTAFNAAPIAGNHLVGDIVYNDTPIVDGNNMQLFGWRCTVAGTPGTWVAMYVSTVTPAT